MNFELRIVQERSGNRYLLKDDRGGIYTISEILFIILTQRKAGIDYSTIALNINALFNTTAFNEQKIAEAEATILKKIAAGSPGEKRQSNYITIKRTLIAAGSFRLGYSVLSTLFKKSLFVLLCSLAILATAVFFAGNGFFRIVAAYQSAVTQLSAGKLLLFYGCFLMIVLIHELGHASATYRFGLKPKEIGAGFYFIFPVFYTNVTDIWELSVKKRIVVNIGGIYFQLLINLLLTGLYCSGLARSFLTLLITANTISLLSALNPFFRYDGYWIVSDLFRLPNLKGKTTKVLLQLFTRKYRFSRQALPLLVYAAGYALFWATAYCSLARYSLGRLKTIYRLTADSTGPTDVFTSIDFITSTAILIFLIFVITNIVLRTSKAVIYEYKHIPQQA